jgi:hypothetical protein
MESGRGAIGLGSMAFILGKFEAIGRAMIDA